MPSYIFMDESGDLGFDFSKPKTSKFFVVAFLFIDNKKQIDNIVKKVFSSLAKKSIKKHSGVLHSYKESISTRKRLLELIAQSDIDILVIKLNKHKVYAKLKDEKHGLYNYVVNILLDRLMRNRDIITDKKINFIASRRETNRFLNDNFSEYIRRQIQENYGFEIDISIKSPSQEKGLQAIDFVAWSFFRKYEHNDDSYVEIIAKNVIEENELFK